MKSSGRATCTWKNLLCNRHCGEGVNRFIVLRWIQAATRPGVKLILVNHHVNVSASSIGKPNIDPSGHPTCLPDSFTLEYAKWISQEKEKGTVNLQGKSTKDIRCRVLLLIGQRDVSRFHDIARELGEDVPSISTITVPSAGHMANLEHPDFVWKQIETFLSK